ncbi:hypothetical protein BGZ89_010816 [Linnemannia elongata]|nr:hypothetical protein BGZ89_010816 [Linnemannia elongata]
MSHSKLLDLKYQMLQYASHHDHPVNVGIHLTCIPLIVWSALVWGANTGPLIASPSAAAVASGATIPVALSKLFKFAVPNLSMILMTGYANKIAAYVHILSWLAQFVGHGVFEKRAPKLTESVVQAAVLGPYFVLWEFLFFLGYRPQLKRELDVLVKADIAAFRARKALEGKKKHQ